MTTVSIGIGSNIGDPQANVRRAIELLKSLGTMKACSSLYATEPWGVRDQPEFCNAAVIMEVDLSAHALLQELQAIERKMGRTPTYHWGPRVIDLDILEYGTECIDEPNLVLPHPQLLVRPFVLAPLAEMDAKFQAAFEALPEPERKQVKRISPNEAQVL
jgi:2-amino-4-hydroxy-6-hydroxymethyldihydropteridine diphosphokinase